MNYYERKVLPLTIKLKRKAEQKLNKGNIEGALKLTRICAKLLYECNQYYVDNELENIVLKCAHNVDLKYQANESVLFYDGFGIDNRGLAKIYVKGLVEKKRLIYVVDKEREPFVSQVIETVLSNNGKVVFLTAKKQSEKIIELQNIFKAEKPKIAFNYTLPEDVVSAVVFTALKNTAKRYLVNLTDHAFWLGINSFDKVLEFRDYGAFLSNEKRGVIRENIIKLPMYPEINKAGGFQGYPFAFDSEKQKLFFSGGGLYKTIGENGRYYKLVESILSSYDNLVFWYAGRGDRTGIDELKSKFPNRVYLTEERRDLYHLLKKCSFYLSTYPISGGLMTQYAAAAGISPLTLVFGNDASGSLINQKDLNVEFEEESCLLEEIDKLINDKEYFLTKAKRLENSVMKEEDFNAELQRVVDTASGSLTIDYDYIEDNLRQIYLKKISRKFICEILSERKLKAHTVFPIKFCCGALIKIKRKLLKG